jgi:hypothetical protein
LPAGSLVVVRANPAAAGATTLAADLDSAARARKEPLARKEPRKEQGAS